MFLGKWISFSESSGLEGGFKFLPSWQAWGKFLVRLHLLMWKMEEVITSVIFAKDKIDDEWNIFA